MTFDTYLRPLAELRGVPAGRMAVRPDYYPVQARAGYPLQYAGVHTGRWVILSRTPLPLVAPGGLRTPGRAYAGLHAYVYPSWGAAMDVARRLVRSSKPRQTLLARLTDAREAQAERAAMAVRDSQMLMTYTPPTLAAMAARSGIPMANLMAVRHP